MLNNKDFHLISMVKMGYKKEKFEILDTQIKINPYPLSLPS